MDELRECPFCGSSKLHIDINARHPNLFPYAAHVLCLNCLASVGSHGFEQTETEAKTKATVAWNRRQPKPEALTLDDKAVRQIVVTDSGGEVLAVITADKIIEKKGVSVAVDWV